MGLMKLRGNRKLRGKLEGFDQHMNLVLENAEDISTIENTLKLGRIIVRGDNVIKSDGWVMKKDILCRITKINGVDVNTFRCRLVSFLKSIKSLGKIVCNSILKDYI